MKGLTLKIISLFFCAMLVTLSVVGRCSAFELFEDKGVTRAYKWNNSNVSYSCYAKCNGSLLKAGTYAADQYSSAFNKWNNVSSNVHVINTDYDNSNIKFVTVEVDSYWKSLTGVESDSCAAITIPYDTDGNRIIKSSTNTKIRSAVVYVNPQNEYGFYDGININDAVKQGECAKKTLIHELGHALGLGHPTSSYEDYDYIMHQGFREHRLFSAPTANDKIELRKKYGN